MAGPEGARGADEVGVLLRLICLRPKLSLFLFKDVDMVGKSVPVRRSEPRISVHSAKGRFEVSMVGIGQRFGIMRRTA